MYAIYKILRVLEYLILSIIGNAIFVKQNFWINVIFYKELIKKHHLNHKNRVNNPVYRNFLEKIKEPLKRLLLPGDVGLDYGCGKGPALADMFRQDGFEIELYDPLFFQTKQFLIKSMTS